MREFFFCWGGEGRGQVSRKWSGTAAFKGFDLKRVDQILLSTFIGIKERSIMDQTKSRFVFVNFSHHFYLSLSFSLIFSLFSFPIPLSSSLSLSLYFTFCLSDLSIYLISHPSVHQLDLILPHFILHAVFVLKPIFLLF